MNYNFMLDYLYNLGKKGSKLGLKRIRTSAKKFNNPQEKLKNVIHIAGTNGKGSVAAMLDSILREAGYSVGLYTSPHLVDFRERIQLNRKKISKKDFYRLFEKLKNENLTFFEFTTMLAFLYFKEKEPDFVILEVGMGGRYDATNIVNPLISVITKISFDHEKFLGNTISKITKEKCGIIKHSPVFTSNRGKPLKIIESVCKKKKCKLIISDDYNGEISLKGPFQKENAGLASVVAEHLGIKKECVARGLKNVRWPGRVDYIEKNIILDGAHNPSGMKALADYILTLNYNNLVLVFGVSKGKNYKEMLKLIPYDKLILTKADLPRAVDPNKIKVKGRKEIFSDPLEALNRAKSIAEKNDLILVTGSLYLIGDLMKRLNKVRGKTINEFV